MIIPLYINSEIMKIVNIFCLVIVFILILDFFITNFLDNRVKGGLYFLLFFSFAYRIYMSEKKWGIYDWGKSVWKTKLK